MQREIELVLGCQRNDPKAQAAFYNLYKGRLLGICRRYARTVMEAEDIFQEAFIKIFNKIHDLQKVESVEYWVKSLVVRTAIDHYRQAHNERQFVDYTLLENESDGDFGVISKISRDELVSIINQLPDGYRMVVNLYLIDGYEHNEIAKLLQISEGTSKSQLSRAKVILRKKLEEIGVSSRI
ncbi:MAG: RNA polymerase sigma factor [Spirosomaceae bacterium]|nr:RNA polymerase sigma factor [Spirosomataceae bacterium]